MPKMILKQESRLNGVKTNIFNLDEVAWALRVPGEGKWLNTYLMTLFFFSYHQVLVCWAGRKQGEEDHP